MSTECRVTGTMGSLDAALPSSSRGSSSLLAYHLASCLSSSWWCSVWHLASSQWQCLIFLFSVEDSWRTKFKRSLFSLLLLIFCSGGCLLRSWLGNQPLGRSVGRYGSQSDQVGALSVSLDPWSVHDNEGAILFPSEFHRSICGDS